MRKLRTPLLQHPSSIRTVSTHTNAFSRFDISRTGPPMHVASFGLLVGTTGSPHQFGRRARTRHLGNDSRVFLGACEDDLSPSATAARAGGRRTTWRGGLTALKLDQANRARNQRVGGVRRRRAANAMDSSPKQPPADNTIGYTAGSPSFAGRRRVVYRPHSAPLNHILIIPKQKPFHDHGLVER